MYDTNHLSSFPVDPTKVGDRGLELRLQDSRRITFAVRSDVNPARVGENGLPIYHDVEYIKIEQAGERDFIERPVRESDKFEFQQQYQYFLQHKKNRPEGVPLSLIFPSNPSIVQMLEQCSVYTCEQLAALNDTALQGIGMGASAWKARAASYLQAARQGEGAAELLKKMEFMQTSLDNMKRDREALIARVEELETAAHSGKKSGR